MSQSLPNNGLSSVTYLGWWRFSLCFSIVVAKVLANHSFIDRINPNTALTVYFLNTVMIKSIWMCTLIMALPIKVAVKNFLKGILKWPHVMPAKSNRGLGIDAHKRMVINPYFCKLSNNTTFAFSIKVLFYFVFKKWI